jgi:endonuclease G
MKKAVLIILAVIIYSCKSYHPGESGTPYVSQAPAPELEPVFPYAKNPDDIISHTGFSFLFNDAHKQSDWTVYMVCRDRLSNPVTKRKDNFRPDPAVKTGTATAADYRGSGFDRGHLVPVSDMLWSDAAMKESSFFSNISPHLPTFHQAGGIWYKLEDLVKIWAMEYDTLYVVAGPALKQGIRESIGKNQISVAEYFNKVILNYTSERIEGIGFIMPHETVKSGNPVWSYAVSIDSVQTFTGIDFFHKLPDIQEKYIETRLCESCWIWQKPKK